MQQLIQTQCAQLGIPAYGFCRFDETDLKIPCRARQRVFEHAKTILVCAFPYRLPSYSKDRNLSMYACVPDYHVTAKQALIQLKLALEQHFPDHQFEEFMDISPFDEVTLGAKAGLGVVGSHSLLIHPRFGSYFFIGEILMSADLNVQDAPILSCMHCGACESQCDALANGHVDQSKCVSALTQKKGELTMQEQDRIRANGLVWGCDRCQLICPMNKEAVCEPFLPFTSDVIEQVTLDHARALCKTRAFGFRGAAVIERNLRMVSSQNGHTESDPSVH